jgi:hypothetical protein
MIETITICKDDMDGSPDADSHVLELDGIRVTIDLTSVNFKELSSRLEMYFEKGRRVSGKRPNKGRTHVQRVSNAKIRAWGVLQPEWRGKIRSNGAFPRGLREAYEQAHS